MFDLFFPEFSGFFFGFCGVHSSSRVPRCFLGVFFAFHSLYLVLNDFGLFLTVPGRVSLDLQTCPCTFDH